MAIAFGAIGAGSNGITSLSVPLPASIAAGDLLVLCIANKYPPNAPATPAGWVAGTNYREEGGSGASGTDTGSVFVSVYTRVADGAESGNVAVTITGGNCAFGRMLRYTKSASATWDLVLVNGVDTTADASWSVALDAMDVHANDMVLVASATNTDLYTHTVEALVQTGTTFGTMVERNDIGTTNGDDCWLFISEHPVSSGAGAGALTYTATPSGTATNNPAGASVALRMRELFTSSGTGAMGAFGASGTATADVPAFTSSGTGAMGAFGGVGIATSSPPGGSTLEYMSGSRRRRR